MSKVAIKNPEGAIDDASKMTKLANDAHERLEEMFKSVNQRLATVDGETKQAFMNALTGYYAQARDLEQQKRNLADTSVKILMENVGNDQQFAKRIAGIH
jgi:hypothetical protein